MRIPKKLEDALRHKVAEQGRSLRQVGIELVRQYIDGTASQLKETANATPAPALPGVREFLAHCERGDCEHAREWKAIKTELVQKAYDAMPVDLVRQKADALGLIPKEIIIRDIGKLIPRLKG